MNNCDQEAGLGVVEAEFFLDEGGQDIEGLHGPMQRAVRAGDDEQRCASDDRLIAFDGAQCVVFDAE